MKSERILIIGSNGQIGSVLSRYLRGIYGDDRVIACDIKQPVVQDPYFEILDATNGKRLSEILRKHKVTQVYHLAAILSATGEQDPLRTWDINMQTYFNVLEASREHGVRKIFYPSSIAVFGAHANGIAEQYSFLDPSTVYGISKAAGENWSNYYFKRYGLDIRSLRYPGIISHQSLPGGGTTDYAVDIFHKAVKGEHFECFLSAGTTLPMIYMSDAMDATVRLMEASQDQVRVRTSYNLSGLSFSPKQLASSIRKFIPDFAISYKPDFRQQIADSWPQHIDDTFARKDWGWRPAYTLDEMTEEMIDALRKQYDVIHI